jgi:hypothetical protein
MQRFTPFILLLVMGLGTFTVMAQPDRILEPFSAGGVTNLLRYVPETEDVAMAAREAVGHAIDVYMPLWDPGTTIVPFQTVIDVLNEEDDVVQAEAAIKGLAEIPESFGDVTFTGTTACHVTVYALDIFELDIAPVLAHEIAHCFQDHYIVGSHDGTTIANSSWWAEGTAEWLASLAYPEYAAETFGLGVAQDELLYLSENNQPLTDTASHNDDYGGYGSLYLWQFLASPGGLDSGMGSPETVLASVRDVPVTIASLEDYDNYLARELVNAPEEMHDFGVALARQNLAFQPMPSELFGTPEISALPFSFEVEANDFTLDFDAFEFFLTEGVEAIQVSTRGLSDASIMVSVNNEGNTYTRIGDDSPVTLCLPETGVVVRVVTTRADGDSDSTFVVRMEPALDAEDCTSPALGESSTPSCINGTWQLTSDPMEYLVEATQGSVHAESTPGLTIVGFAADGSVAYTIDGFTLAIGDGETMSGGVMTMNAAMTGRISYVYNDDGTYTVSDFDMTVQDLSVVANINGFEMDMTDMALSVLDVSNSFAPTPARLTCRGDMLDWVIVHNGEEYVWSFSRID